jgi:CBS domain-containing protein
MPLLARDLMQSEPVTIPPEAPLLQIVNLFVVAQIRSAAVVDDRGTVLGLVSTTDLLRAIDQACDEDVDAGEPANGPAGALGGLATLTARELASPQPAWVPPDAPAGQVARFMRSQGIHSVLVGEGGTLAGILSAFDLLAALEG